MKISQYICQNAWTIGFVEDGISSFLENKPFKVHWVKNNYSDRWFADPFILDVTDTHIFVLVEEFYDPIYRGRISKLTINRKDYRIERSECVLELPTHLSFPSIRRDGDVIYIVPENYESGRSIEYIYNPESNTCTQSRVLCEMPLTDAIVTNLFGKEQIFSTCFPDHKTLNVLARNEGNDYFSVERTIGFDKETARNAGDWFEYNGKVYRPAQDCSGEYGAAFTLQEVIKEGNSFVFKNIRRVEPTSAKYNLGCHTFNSYKGLIVLDAKAKRYPFLFRLFSFLRSLYYGVKS